MKLRHGFVLAAAVFLLGACGGKGMHDCCHKRCEKTECPRRDKGKMDCGKDSVTLFIRHKVKDYAEWRKVYDEHGEAREKAGAKMAKVFRTDGDDNDVTVVVHFADAAAAKAFADNADLKSAMEKAGVTGEPVFWTAGKTECSASECPRCGKCKKGCCGKHKKADQPDKSTEADKQ